MRYDLTDLKLFRAIAETASLSAGAASICLSASSASYRLKNLERTIGAALFLRTTKGMELTPAAEHLLKHVTRIFSEVESMHGALAGFAKGMRGNVRLFANSSSINGFLPRDLPSFLLSHNQVNIALSEHSSNDIARAVGDGISDIGIMASDIKSGDLQVFSYAKDELSVVVPLGHPLADRSAIQFGDALRYDFVCMNRSSSNYTFFSETAARLGMQPNIRVHVDGFSIVLRLVAKNVGVALVPNSVLENWGATDDYVTLKLLDKWAQRNLSIVVRCLDNSPFYIKCLVNHLRGIRNYESQT